MSASEPVSVSPQQGLRSRPAAVLAAVRPAHWTKNAVVLAPLVFALRLGDVRSVLRSLAAAAAFCLLSSAGYLVNDVVDRARDREHPVKRRRPVASGELPAAAGLIWAAGLGVAGLTVSAGLGPETAACAAAYLGLQLLYSRLLKHVVIVDVTAVAVGFVLRVVAGAAAIAVPVSSWLYLCTLLLALFLALEKRRAELALLTEGAGRHRLALGDYSPALLDQLVAIASSCAVLAYALYTLAPETIARFGNDRLRLSIPFVIFGIFRYLFLVHRRGAGGEPERVLLRDRVLQLDLAAWLLAVAWALYF